MSSLVLGQDHGGVGSDTNIAAKRHGIAIAARHGPEIIAGLAGKNVAVPTPIAVETHAPQSVSRQPDAIGGIGAVGEVEDHDDIVARPAPVPAMEGDDLV